MDKRGDRDFVVAACPAAAICILALFAAPTLEATAQTVEVEVRDPTPFHVFPPGTPFSFEILATVSSGPSPKGLAYQWRDFRGEALGPVISFDGGVLTTVSSPSEAPSAGYYGLALLADDPEVEFNEASGSRPEIGFAVLPPRAAPDRSLDLGSPFGIVHADLDDPHLSTWVKTLTWNTVGASNWNLEMTERRDGGLQELPLVSGDGWVSDDAATLPDDFISALRDKIRPLLEGDPLTEHWELGLEENLSSRFNEPFYFQNLRAKAAAIRDVVNGGNPNLKLLFQIGGRNLGDAEAFFASEAAGEFDILAPHPYAWPDFPPPEEWLEAFVLEWRGAMKRHNVDFPMWFTEIGAPLNDAQVEQMFSGGSPVRGLSRTEHPAYLIKAHVLSLTQGIDKIFWYNYVDRDSSTTDVEDHFGLIDFWGFPKPSYAAYATMLSCMGNNGLEEVREFETAHIYEFGDAKQRCIVAWIHPASERKIPLSAIRSGLNVDNIIAITNTVGTPLPIANEIPLDEHPVFITTRVVTQPPSAPNVVANADSDR